MSLEHLFSDVYDVGHTILLFTSNFYEQSIACFSALNQPPPDYPDLILIYINIRSDLYYQTINECLH
ncbi:hypothetical protein WN51_02525 [Melipona quadrifasciata]|uniref:Uncharacterized protein n=1 Tax=Melipona quadrifasciata TaxID=166423 RepID=A0A0M8ZVM9_9HYME|nr:hypothetical protein WN51_02525 [Melipona quadrifasciata]